MDSICNATTVNKIRKILESMPTNYEEAYKDTFDRILKQNQERQSLALSALNWICNSRRSLDMLELQHAIASLDEAPEYTPEYLESEKTILSSCLGFLVHSKSGQAVGLVHLSAREFVLKQLNSQAPTSNLTIGRACLKYMAVPEMSKGPCRSLDELKARIAELPFLDYATRHYGYHIRPVEDDLLAELVAFLSDAQFRKSSWQMLHFVVDTESQSALDLINRVPSQATILHVACYWGLSSLFQTSLAISWTVGMLNQGDSHGWSPLHWASSNGHDRLAAGLLEAGANIDAVDKGSWTPLFWAVVRGHYTVVRLLLDAGSNPCNPDENGFTPAHWAILAGARDMITLLVGYAREWGFRSERLLPTSRLTVETAKAIAKPKNLFQLVTNVSDNESFEKLASAYDPSEYFNRDFGFDTEHVSALWDKTKIVTSKSDYGFWSRMQKSAPIDGVRKQLLKNAILCGDVELVKAILSLNRDLGKELASDVVSTSGGGYVHVAAYSESTEIMRILGQAGLSLTAADSLGLTPLHYACRSGSREMVEIILEANVEVDARDKQQRTPLMLLLRFGGWRACHNPGTALMILKALVARGASVHASDSGRH
jgi:ankyrin repeat protein